ncbi:hypothetical protein [Streptomyces sp. NBC_01643]|uniref:hypothetical protein n=1 Tax=Streptomyces sp. NBC_01643 TaxID=2975906 RepID=UPI002F90C5AB|nr:hypothetical protein OHB03_48140 [Streptomyces sp. NBC_01643]
MNASGVHIDSSDPQHRIRSVATKAAILGGLLFLLGTALHPARDGHGVAEAGKLYGITHDLQAIGLLFQVVAIAGLLALASPISSRHATAIYTALIGTLSWFALIVYDGSHNPAIARYAPDLVHTPEDLEIGGAILVMPALVLFPIGYVVLAVALARRGMRIMGILLGFGAVTYVIGGLLVFVIGPHSTLVQIVEVVGAVPYALGFIVLGSVMRAGSPALR